jgi:hypothetical protein
VTQDAARDTPFRQEISHTVLRRERPFRKFNREKLDKERSPPPGSSGLTAARGAVGPDRAPAGPDREDHPLGRAPDQRDSAISRMSARDDDGSSDVPASIWNAILCR